MKRRFTLFLLVAFATAAAPAAAEHEWKDVERVVAIGDVHGAYDNFVAVLENTGLVDDNLKWSGGKTHLVQLGDVVDRGARSRDCMELLMRLEKEAKKAGGYVHALIGNHEAMNMVGILDSTSMEELASYDDDQARRTREKAFEKYFDELRQQAKTEDTEPPAKNEARRDFDEQYAPGYFGHRIAFSPSGRYGKWIRKHNAAIRINDTVFTHGDWSLEFSALGIEDINKRIQKELSGRASLQDGYTFDLKAPLQYRGLSEVPLTREQQDAHLPKVNEILSNLGAKRLVVGHTTTDGAIEPRFGGKHISADVGMLELYQGGHQVALEIKGDALWGVHPEGKIDLPEYIDENSELDYLVAVAAVDPANINIHRRLAEGYLARGEHELARDAIEQLFEIDRALPFRYRKTLGDVYRAIGEEDKALEQYRAFIAGHEKLIEKNPENPYIRNTLARFCLENNLRIDIAQKNIEAALRLSPQNQSLLLTQGRLQFRRNEYEEASRTLQKVVEGKASYEAFYYLGLSYLELDEEDKARGAFESALEQDPKRAEAQNELRKLKESRQPQGGANKP